MTDYLIVSMEKARAWLADGAQQCGYPPEQAGALVYCAWWLENRQVRGMLRASMYLLSIQGRPYESLMPREENGRVVGLCPVMLGGLIAINALEKPEPLLEWSGFVTADPLLLAPISATRLKNEYDLDLKYADQDMTLAKDGIELRSESLLGFGLVESVTGVPSAIRRIEPKPREFTHIYSRNTFLQVPAKRYGPHGEFLFDRADGYPNSTMT
jgi:hypothetical protein